MSNFYVFKSFQLLNKSKTLSFLFNLKSQDFNLIIVCSKLKTKNEVFKTFRIPIIFLNDNRMNMNYCYQFNFLNLTTDDRDIVYFLIFNIISRYKNCVKF